MLSIKLVEFLSFLAIVSCDHKLLIDQLRWDFLEIENDIRSMLSSGLMYKPLDQAELYLVKRFYNFDKKLQQMPGDNLRGLQPLRAIPDFLFVYSEFKVIENKYEKFREYNMVQINKKKNQPIMEDIIYDILNNETMKKSIDHVYDLLITKDESIMQEMLHIVNQNFWCKDIQQSPQQLFYNLYNVFSLNELKVFIMQQFAYFHNILWSRGNNTELSILVRKDYEKRVIKTIAYLKTVMKYPKDIWRCDPKSHVRGKTFDEFTRFLQGHIQNEIDMGSGKDGTCQDTCEATQYSFTTSRSTCTPADSDFCLKVPRCNGKIIGCFFEGAKASICVSNLPDRRYDYVNYIDKGKILGKLQYCSNKRIANSWTSWFVRCNYCMCLCDQHGRESDRYINLRPVKADIKNNRVVTGLRLIKHNRILHIQIQEGKLLPYGYINESTVHWAPVDNYTITTTESQEVRDGEDYFTLTYERRSMVLDDIQVYEDDYIVTGARFELINDLVHFEIHVNRFNWQTGIIEHNGGYYIYESNPNGRLEISLSHADVPTFTNKPSEILFSGIKSYVNFTHTDFGKDVAQTTIPFIDTQEVFNNPAVPLMGAGIYYKGSPGYGGFLAPRIKTYDYEKHMFISIPKMDD